MEAEREGREDCGAVARRLRAKGLFDMLQAAAGRHPMTGKKSKLCRTVHQPFESIESVDCGDLPDPIHSCVNVERREAFGAALDLSDALADLVPDWPE
jgi:hypothetical protein